MRYPTFAAKHTVVFVHAGELLKKISTHEQKHLCIFCFLFGVVCTLVDHAA